MKETATVFGDMLTEAIRTIKSCEGKSIAIIQDELAIALERGSGKTVERWRAGNLPPTDEDRAELARLVHARSCGRLSRHWFERFLKQMRYPNVDTLCDALFAVPVRGEHRPIRILNIPNWTRQDVALINRHTELATLRELWGDVVRRRSLALFVDGDAGIGKTRLIQAFLSDLPKQPICLLRGRAAPQHHVQPYLTLSDALYPLLAFRDQLDLSAAVRHELAQWLPGFAPSDVTLPLIDAEQAHARRRWAFYTLIVTLAKRVPVIIWLDDIQWADTATMQCLEQILLQKSKLPIFLIGTVRSAEIAEQAAYDQLRANLYRSNQLTDLSLQPLDEAETWQLSQQTADVPLLPDLRAKLYPYTQGNPFFIIEIMTALQMRENDQLPIPDGVAALVRLRLHQFDEQTRRFLEIAAVMGREFEVEMVGEIGRFEESALDHLLDKLEDHKVIELSRNTGAFTHLLFRDVIYSELSARTRRRWHSRIADALVAQGGAMVQLAHHHHQAERWEAAFDYALQAGQELLQQFENKTARIYLEMAQTIALDEELPLSDEQVFVLHAGLGDAYRHLTEWELSVARYEDAISSLRENAPRQAEICRKIGTLYVNQNRFALAIEWLERGMVIADKTESARVAIQRSLIGIRQGDLGTALAWAEQASVVETAQGQNLLATLYKAQGNLVKARQHCERSVALARENQQLIDLAKATTNLGVILFAENDWQAAVAANEEAVALHASLGNRFTHAMTLCNLADVLRHLGQFDAAIERAEAALLESEWVDSPFFQAHAQLNIGAALFALDGTGEDSLEAAYTHLKDQEIGELLSESAGLRALCRLAAGDIVVAESLAQEALAVAEGRGEPVEIGRSQRILAQVQHAQNDLASARKNLQRSIDLLAKHDLRYELGVSYLRYARLFADEIELANDYLAQARRLFTELGAAHELAQLDG